MADDNAGIHINAERENAAVKLRNAMAAYLEHEQTLLQLNAFLARMHGINLDRQEREVRNLYLQEIHPKMLEIREIRENHTEEDPLGAPFVELIEQLTNSELNADEDELNARKERLLALAAEVCEKLGGIQFRLHSVIGPYTERIHLEIFQNLLTAYGDLLQVQEGVLNWYHGIEHGNNETTVHEKMNCGAKITGTIIFFLTEVTLKLPGFDIEPNRRDDINDIINRSIRLYIPEQFFEFVRALANNQRLPNLENSLEESRVTINSLVDDIEGLTNY
ncbi:hypothetical protein GCK72_011732 [Caenorhabditis remanei]|uniref:Uncharacterized protein n=1 Tax=Caenorhabditis remanei TaxID=31234 RepID=A0A6A5H9C3_CAERE|nr:hypothetical protein GCK72_011732 [Caenorhabditis remanei]KAF1763466.1 hypothetical protein GCK72_011732 [Caenorhabditis remanei]